MSDKKLETIQETIENLLTLMGFEAEVEIIPEKLTDPQETISVNIKVSADSNLLIGQHGINLESLQHIARLVVRKKIEEKISFSIDINSYRAQKNESIIDQARELAQKALNEKRSVVMRPMSAYERRLVHLELKKNALVATESIGEGEERKIVIKPAPENNF